MSVEVEHHHVDHRDNEGKVIGIQVAIIAVLLSVFTIYAHRAHTDTILLANQSSNTWSHYQAKRIRAYQVEMNTGLVKLMAPNSTETAKLLEEYQSQTKKYDNDLEEINHHAKELEEKGEIAHHKAGYFDLAEGVLEIAMILTSLFFIARKRLFPTIGLVLGVVGVIIGVLGMMVH